MIALPEWVDEPKRTYARPIRRHINLSNHKRGRRWSSLPVRLLRWVWSFVCPANSTTRQKGQA